MKAAVSHSWVPLQRYLNIPGLPFCTEPGLRPLGLPSSQGALQGKESKSSGSGGGGMCSPSPSVGYPPSM